MPNLFDNYPKLIMPLFLLGRGFEINIYSDTFKLMTELAIHFEKKHAQLREKYSGSDNQYVETTYLTAKGMEFMLNRIQSEHKPVIINIKSEGVYPDGSRVPLRSKLFEDKSWDVYFVCVAGGIVYDPILPEPKPLDIYFEEVFDANVFLEFDTSF